MKPFVGPHKSWIGSHNLTYKPFDPGTNKLHFDLLQNLVFLCKDVKWYLHWIKAIIKHQIYQKILIPGNLGIETPIFHVQACLRLPKKLDS